MRADERSRLRDELEPPWDEVREQRVLARVLEEQRAGTHGRTKHRVFAVGIAASLAVAAGAFFIVRGASTTDSNAKVIPSAFPIPAVETASPTSPQQMALADGSHAILLRDAHVQVDVQSADRIHLVQQKGAVRYEVRPDPSREFVVRAAEATVRVRGTVFTVDLSKDAVTVEVERGHVEVADGARVRDLVAGEALRVPHSVTVDEPRDNERNPSPKALDGDGRSASLSAEALLAKADKARIAGNNSEAAASLESLVSLHPRDARVTGALFSLGRVERARGRHGASAQAFERCLRTAPGGPLAADALAEAATSWANAGATDNAKTNATKYLDRYPHGSQAALMRAIVSR